jgi:hypothetical protein
MPPPPKTKEQRVAEGMTIIRKLLDVGVEATNPGFVEIKGAVSKWIADGEPITLSKVGFGRLDRVGELVLPRRQGAEPTLLLRVPRVVK